MNVSITLEMWIQCGPLHVQCGCNVDPPHLHILNVDVMWSNVVDPHCQDVEQCGFPHFKCE